MMRAGDHVRSMRRGGVLLEVTLAIAIFAAAGSVTLAATRSVFSSLDRSRRLLEAVDLARSRLSELEAGLIDITDLQSDDFLTLGSGDFGTGVDLAPVSMPSYWTLDLEVDPTEYPGLSLVTIIVEEDEAAALLDDAPVRYELRQLIAIREAETEDYEEDEILQGLPVSTGANP